MLRALREKADSMQEHMGNVKIPKKKQQKRRLISYFTNRLA